MTCTGKLSRKPLGHLSYRPAAEDYAKIRWRFRRYGDTPCSTTIQQGDIIVGTLEMNGTAGITMDLAPYGFLEVRQVALVYRSWYKVDGWARLGARARLIRFLRG